MAFARGKVILLGEHGVVHGRPALAAGIERGVVATASVAAADRLRVEPWDVVLRADAASDEPLERAFAAILAGYPSTRPAVSVEARCDLPAGAGLGASAAVGVAVIAAIDELLGIARTPEERGAYALSWEKVFHGNPSGVDNTMASCGGIAVYVRGQPLEPVRPRRPIPLVVCYSGESASTKTMVESVARQHERDRARVEEIFDGMAALVRNGKLAVENGDFQALGQMFDMNQMLLASLLLSTERLERLCGAAKAAGALGAKLTGSGGGGCMIALVPDVDRAEPVLRALRDEGGEPFVAEAGR